MDALRVRAIEHGLELGDTWEAESEASRAAIEAMLEEGARQREHDALAAQADAETRAEQATERIRELEHENVVISEQIRQVAQAAETTLLSVDLATDGTEAEEERQVGHSPAAQEQLSLSVIRVGGVGEAVKQCEDAGEGHGGINTGSGKHDYELLDLFFLPDAPLHIQGKLKIAEDICAEALAQRDSAQAELRRQEVERQHEQRLLEELEKRLVGERLEEQELSSQVANELTSLRESVQTKDSALELAQAETAELRAMLEQSEACAERVQRQVAERAVRLWRADLAWDCFGRWQNWTAQTKSKRAYEEVQAHASSVQTELAEVTNKTEQALQEFDSERDTLLLAHEQHVADIVRLHEEQVAMAESETTAQQSAMESYLAQEEQRARERVVLAASQAETLVALRQEVQAVRCEVRDAQSTIASRDAHIGDLRSQLEAGRTELAAMTTSLEQQLAELAAARASCAAQDESVADLRAKLTVSRAELLSMQSSLESHLQSARAELVESANATAMANSEWHRGQEQLEEMHARRLQEERLHGKEQASARLAAAEKSGALATLQTELEMMSGSLARAEAARERQREEWAAERRDLIASYETQLEAGVRATKAALAASNEDSGRQAAVIESLRAQADEVSGALRSQIDRLRKDLAQSVESRQAAGVAWSKERAELISAHERQLMNQSMRTDELIHGLREQSEKHLSELTEQVKLSLCQASEVAGALHLQVQQTRQDLDLGAINPGSSVLDLGSVSAEWGRRLSEQMKSYSEQATEITDALRGQLARERENLSRLVAEKESMQIDWAKERVELTTMHEKQLLEELSASDALLSSTRLASQQRLAEALSLSGLSLSSISVCLCLSA